METDVIHMSKFSIKERFPLLFFKSPRFIKQTTQPSSFQRQLNARHLHGHNNMPPIRSRRTVVRRRSIKRTPMASTPKKIDKDKEPKDVIAGQQKEDNNIKQETSIEEKKDNGGLLLKNNEAKNTSDAGTMTPTTGGAGQPEAPAAAPGSSKIEVYNIRIQQNFKERVVLPPIDVWSRVVNKSSFLAGVLRVCIKRKAFLFDRRLAAGFYTCVLSQQGHLVVYTELASEGFAVNLRKASQLTVKFVKEKSVALPLPLGEPPKRTCKLTAKWRFGTVTIQFLDRKMNQWCTAIVQALSDDPKAQLLDDMRASMLNPPLCKLPGSKEPTTTREEMPAEKHSKQEQCVPALRLMKTVEETTNEQKMEEGTKEQQEQKVTTTGAVNTAGPVASSHSDALDSMVTDSDSNSLEELEEEDNEDTLAEPDAVEDQDSVLDSSLYSELELDDDIGDEEQQQDQREQQAAEKEEANGPPTPPPAPMKRHVTFSNLKTIVEADKEDEEKEAAAEVSPAPSKNNNNTTTGNNSDAEEWMDAVDDDGWWPEEEKKEQAVPSMPDKDWLPMPWTSQGWEPEEEEQAKAGHKNKKECAAHTKDSKTATSCWLPPTTSAAGPVKNLQLHRDAAVQGPKPKPRCIRLRRRVPVNRRRIVKNNAKEEEEG